MDTKANKYKVKATRLLYEVVKTSGGKRPLIAAVMSLANTEGKPMMIEYEHRDGNITRFTFPHGVSEDRAFQLARRIKQATAGLYN